MGNRPAAVRLIACPGGMTLLEVLVACGILVVGLSGVAALLPAASFQLSQASTEDRAGVVAGNANCDLLSRRLATADLCATNIRMATCFGPGLSDLAGVAPNWFAPSVLNVWQMRIDQTRGFWLEDDLDYASNDAGLLVNTFAGGATGPRAYREKVCWSAAVLPGMNTDGTGTADALAGAPATLAVATLRKAPPPGGGAKLFVLSPQTGPAGCWNVEPPATQSDLKTFLGPCSWVLVLPNQPGRAPIRPIQINSSWLLPTGRFQLVIRIPDDLVTPDAGGSTPLTRLYCNTSGQLSAIGIANLIRLDQYFVTLD